MDHTRGAPRTAVLIGSALLCSVVLTGCPGDSGAQSPITGCAAAREMRDLTSTSTSDVGISEVRSTYQLVSRSQPPSGLSAQWKTTDAFMWDAYSTLQDLDDSADQDVFEATWEPLAAELEDSDSDVGRAVREIVSYADENCSEASLPTYGD
ncbi:hypothetical protein [Sanguibacter suarezii]|uniref:hypothetical protein n=1 Tax=Sanguibacter suarezii TaxID=60921 RepID=UPI000836830A|nr:hypothetical protein [Sanguibacter suarezii]